MSQHARQRSQQRAIPELVIDLLLQFGSREKSSGGTSKAFFDKSSRKRIKSYAGPLASFLEPHLDSYVVLSSDDHVVTVGHRNERIRRH
ncbi:hypothetical protein [Hydrogenophaga sp. R2]|uniref:hypothetical protein n=1 Tax=Hydrogenophaga sp. R2 TaxID=3132827 RepID=UPI003CEE5F77